MSEAAHTPAARLIAQFGVDRIAGWARRHRSRVHAWAWPTSKGGTGGAIPPRLQPKIIEGAHRDLGVELSYADFQPKSGEAFLVDA